MNPILISPQIASDEPIEEQLRKMKSYLFRFKEEVELLLSNIDTDNLSEKFEDDFSKVVGSKIMGSKEMSQIIQSAGAIKLEVEELGGSVASLTVATNGIYNQINDPDTGILTELSILDGAIAAAVKFGTNYTGFKITTTNFHINSAGTFTVYGDNFKIDEGGNVTVKGIIKALVGGDIGGFTIGTYELLHGNSVAINYSSYMDLLSIGDTDTATMVSGDDVQLQGGGAYNSPTIYLGDNAGIQITSTVASGILIHGQTQYHDGDTQKTMKWQKLDEIIGNPNAYVITNISG